MYAGSDGINPEISTVCKQMYSVHHMLAIKANGSVTYEPFSIPSSCSCFTRPDVNYSSEDFT